MLSIIIPTYNYKIVTLVNKVYKQALDAKVLFETIQAGNVKFNHDMPKGVIYRNCEYDFKTNQIMLLIEHESFEPLYDGMVPPIYRIKPEE